MSETTGTRRGFITAAAATATVVGSLAFAKSVGSAGGSANGLVTILSGGNGAPAFDQISADVWQAAVNTRMTITGENGTVGGRVLSVVPGVMGGDRPDTLRPQTMIVAFDVGAATAPLGGKTYSVQIAIPGVRELFVTRGEDVMGRAILTAILN
ncbi:MAG: hypothetical protein V4537_05395 [Pseudomonadota bacterium]